MNGRLFFLLDTILFFFNDVGDFVFASWRAYLARI